MVEAWGCKKEWARGGDSDIVGEVPLPDCPAEVLRMAGAETLSCVCVGGGVAPAGSGGGGGGIEEEELLDPVEDPVLTLMREFVKSEYLKGG